MAAAAAASGGRRTGSRTWMVLCTVCAQRRASERSAGLRAIIRSERSRLGAHLLLGEHGLRVVVAVVHGRRPCRTDDLSRLHRPISASSARSAPGLSSAPSHRLPESPERVMNGPLTRRRQSWSPCFSQPARRGLGGGLVLRNGLSVSAAPLHRLHRAPEPLSGIFCLDLEFAGERGPSKAMNDITLSEDSEDGETET